MQQSSKRVVKPRINKGALANFTPDEQCRNLEGLLESLDMATLARISEDLPTTLRAETDALIEDLIESAYSPKTLKVDRSRERVIRRWMEKQDAKIPFTPHDSALFLLHQVQLEYSRSAIESNVAVLRRMHRDAGASDPMAHPKLRQLFRAAKKKTRQRVGKYPLLFEHVTGARAIAQADPNVNRGVRDFSILTLGFVTAMRGGEIANILIEHLEWGPNDAWVCIFIPFSKTDQEGDGQEVTMHASGSPTCPVAALKRWMKIVRRDTGPLYSRIFRNGKVGCNPMSEPAISEIVKRYVAALGEERPQNYGAHSLRAGFVTHALEVGCETYEAMLQSRHKSERVFLGYNRPQKRINFTQRLGL